MDIAGQVGGGQLKPARAALTARIHVGAGAQIDDLDKTCSGFLKRSTRGRIVDGAGNS